MKLLKLLAIGFILFVVVAMEKLNERYRLAVVLRYFQGLGIAEISEVLGCSEGVTKNILFRSVKTMREAMTEGAA